MHRFYLPNFDRPVLEGDEARHAKVLRLRPHEKIAVFDGNGKEAIASIKKHEPDRLLLELGEELNHPVESPLKITLVQAVGKGEKFELVVQKAVELGVSCLVPLESKYTEVQQVDKRRSRWERIIVEATKQCGRRVFMKIGATVKFDKLASYTVPVIFFVERGGKLLQTVLRDIATNEIVLVVGPEGGWSRQELELATAWGFNLVTLGPRTLRTETAGVVAVALVQALIGDIA
ncbi:MAG: RsmE family RNA methyltransferase [Acidobacteriota bacterium]|nr:16S rRNA (uracil(1498)-N(3))-methyltransferase [Blastocatellia bacterium]MDW8413499.1 RsmE family RNA methyltransferase [Acidobacteriota bacterium]